MKPTIAFKGHGQWMAPEQSFRLELPCAIFANDNSSAIQRLTLERLGLKFLYRSTY